MMKTRFMLHNNNKSRIPSSPFVYTINLFRECIREKITLYFDNVGELQIHQDTKSAWLMGHTNYRQKPSKTVKNRQKTDKNRQHKLVIIRCFSE